MAIRKWWKMWRKSRPMVLLALNFLLATCDVGLWFWGPLHYLHQTKKWCWILKIWRAPKSHHHENKEEAFFSFWVKSRVVHALHSHCIWGKLFCGSLTHMKLGPYHTLLLHLNGTPKTKHKQKTFWTHSRLHHQPVANLQLLSCDSWVLSLLAVIQVYYSWTFFTLYSYILILSNVKIYKWSQIELIITCLTWYYF